mgnify:CR=1 FL=1
MFGLSGRQFVILLMLGALAFAATQYVPAYVTAFEFNDFIRQEMKYAVTSRKTVQNVRDDVFKKAKELDVPVSPSDIRVTRRGPVFTLDLEYRLPINLRVYQHELIFHRTESGELFENASH